MSLRPILTVPNCIPYTLWDGVVHSPQYNPYLITLPRIYQEAVKGTFKHFYYDPGQDRLCAWSLVDTYHWPGWAVSRWDFDAGTGAYLGGGGGSIGAIAYVNHAGLGSYSSNYATWRTGSSITEMNPSTMQSDAGMWSIDPGAWSPGRYFYHVVVNRNDGLIVGVAGSSKWLEVWDISGTPTLRGGLSLPNFLGYLAFESRAICWMITGDGLVGKINYKNNPPKWEMFSSVQNPSPDALGYSIAFDAKRNRVAVLRQRPDAADGSCQSQLEFYRPLYRITGLTDPVPVTPLRTGGKTRFVAHLYGDSGEGVGTYPVVGELSEPPAGALLTPNSSTEQSGAASLHYQAPEAAATETLSLSATED